MPDLILNQLINEYYFLKKYLDDFNIKNFSEIIIFGKLIFKGLEVEEWNTIKKVSRE